MITPIKYIGHREVYRDGCCGSGLVFYRNQTINVEDDEIARKMLRHKDVYVLGEADDSHAALKRTVANKASDEDAQQDTRDAITNMSKDALKDFAKNNFSASLDMRKSVGDLRTQVVGMFDQFGAE